MALNIETFAKNECQVDVTVDAYYHYVKVTHLKTGLSKTKNEPKRHALHKLRSSALAELYEEVHRKGDSK